MPDDRTISITCPNCQSVLLAPARFAGRSARCPQCKATVPVSSEETIDYELKPMAQDLHAVGGTQNSQSASTPQQKRVSSVSGAAPKAAPRSRGPNRAAQPIDRTKLAKEILSGFRGPIDRVVARPAYRMMVVFVSVVIVLLPVLYVTLIAIVAWGIYYHLTHHIAIFRAAHGAILHLLIGLLYMAPAIAGAILLFFMIKPILARPRKGRTRSVNPQFEPLLYAFVERICDVVQAPRPKEILVAGEMNAAAGLRRGAWSMWGNDLTLVIGAPLVAGMSLQEFAGVLAHEFGHFSQGAGLRVSFLIRRVNHWLTRVVYQRDKWDAWLAETAAEMDVRLSWILGLAILFVYVTRGILWILMMVGHAVAGAMIRQMEYHADLSQIRLVGSESFESSMRRLSLLNVSYDKAFGLATEWIRRRHRFADNLSALTLYVFEQMPSDVRRKIVASTDEESPSMLATHPTLAQRIARARSEDAPGVFTSELPAQVLFSDFEAVSRGVTWDMYCAVFGTGFSVDQMCPVEDLVKEV